MTKTELIPLVVGLLVVAMLFVPIYQGATSESVEQFHDESSEWCDERGGELVNVHAVVHGGLHCDLPNGTSVHMSEVVGRDG